MKILVVGNCQARPLSNLLTEVAGCDILPPIILHLAHETDSDTHLPLLAEADVILAQQTADTFRVPYLRSEAIRARDKKVLVWPNVFWAVQQPFLRYFTHADYGRILGPLEAMHDLRIYGRWLASKGLLPDLESRLDAGFAAGVQAASLRSLQAREAGCDVSISDFLQ